jgi:hypothetical protein
MIVSEQGKGGARSFALRQVAWDVTVCSIMQTAMPQDSDTCGVGEDESLTLHHLQDQRLRRRIANWLRRVASCHQGQG